MTVDNLHRFLTEVQKEDLTEEEAHAVMVQSLYDFKHLTIFHRKALNLDAFFKFLLFMVRFGTELVYNLGFSAGLVGIIVLRDVGLVGGAVYQRASSLGWKWKRLSDFFNLDGTRPQKVEPLFISKVNTVFQFILVAAALLQPEFETQETQSYITYLSWLVASTTMASTAAYGVQHLKKSAALAQKS